MTKTIMTPQTPSEDEYAIVATFSDASLEQLAHMQSQLHDLLGDAIWLTPQRALHSTLMEIICDSEYEGLSRQQHFLMWYEQYHQIVSETIAEFSPLTITFSQLEVSARAIIVKSADSSSFNALRATLLSRTKLPEGTKLPPDITHCSLARFTTALDLNDIIKRTKPLTIAFTEHITKFALLRDLGPPSFTPETIETYSLI